MNRIFIPEDYDYVGVYLTNRCHLNCPYCITEHFGCAYQESNQQTLTAEQWIEGLNRLVLPKDVPITLQGGEPFLYEGIWKILEEISHKADILTALPPFLTKGHFLKLKTLDWNRRIAPYPTIRVSYHKGQNDHKVLTERIAEFQKMLSIGLYYLEYPEHTQKELKDIKEYADRYEVELRKKEFLGEWNNRIYGTFLYKDAAAGRRKGIDVLCRNTIVPIGCDGTIYRCHSDLYFNRKESALGNILDEDFRFPDGYLHCENYGLCNECDVKIKTNHYQVFGYTSADIKFLKDEVAYESKKT